MAKSTTPKPKFESLDRVTTPDGYGMVLRRVPNMFLLRPGYVYEVELDNGDHVDYNECDLTP